MSEIKFFHKNNWSEIDWYDIKEGDKIQAYFSPFVGNPSNSLISNVDVDLFALIIDDVFIPFTINNVEYTNSYVTSPYNHYVTYAREEINMLKNPITQKIFRLLLKPVNSLAKLSQIDKIIYLNNWFLSTNLYFELSEEQCLSIVEFLIRKFPDYAISFRSINQTMYPELFKSLNKNHFLFIPSRYVYLFNSTLNSLPSQVRKTHKRDKKLLEKFELISHKEFCSEDIPKIVELYNQLYLDKYSIHNPQFTLEFMKNALENNIFTFYGLKMGEKLVGVGGFLRLGNSVVTPIFGYDITLPRDLGIYRVLNHVLFNFVAENNLFLHASAGAGEFKFNRGCFGDIEYNAVFLSHLPKKRHFFWKVSSQILNKFAIKIVKNNKL